MKKLISIIAVAIAICMCMTVVSFAKTADLVHTSVEGTAVIDGEKDDAYANALALDFVQKGESNGSGETLDAPIGTAYIINDASYVYVYVDVLDTTIDNTSGNVYEQDSVEGFWMVDNAKAQCRFHYDGTVDDDSGAHDEFAAKMTDTGYAIEYRFPITDVLNNQIEMCIQINYASEGKREYTCFIANNAEGDNAWQRSNRQSEFDCWWTLTLAGDHADSRVDPEPEAMELTAKNFDEVRNAKLSASIHTQNNVSWDDWKVWTTESYNIGLTETVEIDWTSFDKSEFTAEKTKDWTVLPQFSLDLNDAAGYLKMPADAVEGDKGDNADFAYTYTDIVISAEGYEDVIIPGATVSKNWEIYIPSWGGTAGNGDGIDLATGIKNATGWTVEEVVNFMAAITEIKTTITFDSLNLVNAEVISAFEEQLNAEDEAKVAELQQYVDRVEAAKATIADEAADLEAKKAALDDARKAANRSVKDAGTYTKALEVANGLVSQVEELTKTVEELEAAAAAVPETPAEDENKAEENKPADTTPKDEKSSNTGLIVGIVIAVVVIAVIAVVAVMGKKKKA